MEQIEDALSGLKVIDFDENCIRLSLRTYLPKLEELSCQIEDAGQPSEINHELMIVLVSGTMELKDVEVAYILFINMLKQDEQKIGCLGTVNRGTIDT